MRRIVINMVLTVIIAVLILSVALPFLAFFQFEKAKTLELAYRWKKAEEKYQLAVRLAPFDAKYPAEYADFLIRQSDYRKNEMSLIMHAEELYRRAIVLNPRYAEYYLALGKLELYNYRRTLKPVELENAVENFKNALKNDPNGFNISYSIGYFAIPLWNSLDGGKKEFIAERLKYALKLRPWHGKYIYPLMWKYTNNFEALKHVTPPTVYANRALYDFIRANNLWQFRKEQAETIDFYRKKEDAETFQREKLARLAQLEKEKKAYENTAGAAKNNPMAIMRKDWHGKAEGIENAYKDGNMSCNGTISAVTEVPDGVSIVRIVARGSQSGSIWPYMIVRLDDEVIGETFVDNKEWKEYAFDIDASAGLKVLSIT
ncbi:MAG: hypothetical protein JW994_02625, partial [Candidatus Omnitrophica bacterium]|nr:hypothetical protein [Candidatus Omnitrophota bacterium]